MDGMQVSFLVFLGVLELTMLAIAASVFFLLRGNRLSRKLRSLEKKLKESGDAPKEIGFDQYLRDEIIRNEALTEQAEAAEDEAEKKSAELLKFRKRFLEIELEAHALTGNPVAYQDKIAAGMCELVEIMRPGAETIETQVETEPDAAVELEEVPDDEAEDDRKTIDTSDEEMNHLKDVINNQQDAMAALRAQLEAHDEVEGIGSILKQLEDFEKQSAELERCLLMLETENERLKASKGAGETTRIEPADPAQLTGLKNMVGNQQETIEGLRKLINELMPEADKAGELESSLDKIQKNNVELSGCVSVLEDENNMLRNELKEIEKQLEQADAEQGEEKPASHSEQLEEMEIKVQELEALVEFKDATIEELEKQYHTLEVKYREATGEQGA